MLQPLPPGFPTPDSKDPDPLARALGRASAMWMRGAYADAAKKVDECAQLAVAEHARDFRCVDASRVASLLRVSAALATLVEEMTTRGVTDPSSIPISLEIDSANLTESELMAAQSMVVASADIESVRRELHADAPRPPPARPGPPPPPPKAPRALSTTMQQASRPTIPEARVEEAPPPNIGSAHTIDLRRTLPQGVGDPRVSQPTPPPAPETTVDPSSSPTTVSAAREDLEFPSLPFGAPTTNPVPYGAKYPPSEAMPSGETTRRAPEPEMSETPAEEKKE